MNPYSLLSKPWVPLHNHGVTKRVSIKQLLCGEETGEICLPRDDLELAALQLLVTIVQVCFPPQNLKELRGRLREPLSHDEFMAGIEGKSDWFDLNHPDTPFMQTRNVKAKKSTPLDKLLPGLADGTNKCFINPQGLAEGLCGSCVAIALFNIANNCPGVGGGFKDGLRGRAPITQLIKGRDLRETVWLNVLHKERLDDVMPWHQDKAQQKPNYVDPVKAGEKILASEIGLTRGLLWQPAHFELLPAREDGHCSVCNSVEPLFTAFNKEKFTYTVEGVWPHPLSARVFDITKGEKKEKFVSFTTAAPGWTQLSRLVVARQSEKEGQAPAPVLDQAKELIRAKRLQFVIGGYRNKQATIVGRRHEFFSLADGWNENADRIHNIIDVGLGYKAALRRSLYLFAVGVKDQIKGSGVNLYDSGEALYFEQTEHWVHATVGSVDFSDSQKAIDEFQSNLKITVLYLFKKLTQSYRHEPKMLKALALARRSLNKSLKDLQEPSKGENNAKVKNEEA